MKPSAAELIVLKALWAKPESLMRDVHAACETDLDWSLSSTRTTVARMVDKGLVTVNKPHGVAVYSAAVDKVGTLAGLAQDFMRRVLEVDTPLPVAAFTGSQILTNDEIAELEKLLDDAANTEPKS